MPACGCTPNAVAGVCHALTLNRQPFCTSGARVTLNAQLFRSSMLEQIFSINVPAFPGTIIEP